MNATTPSLKFAEHLSGYRLRLTFDDGKVGELNLEDQLWDEVFEPLRDIELFREFRVDAELKTIVWPNAADFAPEYLYEAYA